MYRGKSYLVVSFNILQMYIRALVKTASEHGSAGERLFLNAVIMCLHTSMRIESFCSKSNSGRKFS